MYMYNYIFIYIVIAVEYSDCWLGIAFCAVSMQAKCTCVLVKNDAAKPHSCWRHIIAPYLG